mgnify:CR=1 FL=1
MNKWMDSTPEFSWLGLLIFIGGPIMGTYMELLMGPLAGWVAFSIIEIMAIGLLISIIQSIREMK